MSSIVKVRSLNPVFKPVGSEHAVTQQEAAALVALGNAEVVREDDDGTPGSYLRSDIQAGPRHGNTRKNRQ